MKVVVAFSGFYERTKEESWRPAWPDFRKHFYDINQQHEIINVFHTWSDPTPEMIEVIRPAAWEKSAQIEYNDQLIPSGPRKVPGYRGSFYNNFKNRLHSYTKAVELAKRFSPDVIFLTRFDVTIKFDIRLDSLPLSRDEIHTGNWLVPKHHFVCDHYFLGHHEVIERMVKLEDHYNEKMFEDTHDYAKWIVARQEKGRLLKDQNWLTGHTIYPWFFYSNGIKWHTLGKQDSDTWLVRQALKNGQASHPDRLEPYVSPFSFSRPDPIRVPTAQIVTTPVETSDTLPSLRACPHCGKPLPDTL
jgi:hypothetical protein